MQEEKYELSIIELVDEEFHQTSQITKFDVMEQNNNLQLMNERLKYAIYSLTAILAGTIYLYIIK